MSYSWFITGWWGGRKRKGRTRVRGEKCVAVSGREGSLENKRHINLYVPVSILSPMPYCEQWKCVCASSKFYSWSSWWSVAGQTQDVISFIQHDLCVENMTFAHTHTGDISSTLQGCCQIFVIHFVFVSFLPPFYVRIVYLISYSYQLLLIYA